MRLRPPSGQPPLKILQGWSLFLWFTWLDLTPRQSDYSSLNPQPVLNACLPVYSAVGIDGTFKRCNLLRGSLVTEGVPLNESIGTTTSLHLTLQSLVTLRWLTFSTTCCSNVSSISVALKQWGQTIINQNLWNHEANFQSIRLIHPRYVLQR